MPVYLQAYLDGSYRGKLLPTTRGPENPTTGLSNYFSGGLASTNDFTTILFGCTPAGIMVSRE